MTTSLQAGPAAILTKHLATMRKYVRWVFRGNQSLDSSQERDKYRCLQEIVRVGSYF